MPLLNTLMRCLQRSVFPFVVHAFGGDAVVFFPFVPSQNSLAVLLGNAINVGESKSCARCACQVLELCCDIQNTISRDIFAIDVMLKPGPIPDKGCKKVSSAI